MMKPKGQTEHDDGMLEFLEDIIGSNRFKEPIEVLAKRVETLNELRGEKVGIDLDKSGYQENSFLISRQKHMLWVLIRSASLRHFY